MSPGQVLILAILAANVALAAGSGNWSAVSGWVCAVMAWLFYCNADRSFWKMSSIAQDSIDIARAAKSKADQ